MQGKIRSNCCSEISFKNSFNIYKLLSLHFTGLVLLRMVTATVQRERQQQEQSNRTSDVLQHTPLLRSNRRGSPGRAPGADRLPRATPGPPQSASASATPPQSLSSGRESGSPRPSTALWHPAPTSPHPAMPRGQFSPAAHGRAGWAPLGRGRVGKGSETQTWPNPPLSPSSSCRVGGRRLCGSVRAPTEHKDQWERAGSLLAALLFVLEREEEEEDAYARRALRPLSRAGTG